MYRVPVLASAWPKNLEVARLRSGWRVVNHCCGMGGHKVLASIS